MAELALCDQMGIPHNHFLGGPLLWTDADQEKALAYQQFKANVCKCCGTEPDEWDPAKGGHRDAYVTAMVRCEGGHLLGQEQANINKLHEQYGDAVTAGVRPALIPRAAVPDLVDDEDEEPADV